MFCKKDVLTIVGTSMWIEVYQSHGQDSRSFYCEKKNLLQDTCGPGSAVRRSKQLPDLILCGLKFGLACQKQLRRRRRKNGLWRSQRSTTLEDSEAFVSSIRKMEREKEAFKNSRKKFEILMEAAMLYKTGTKKCLKKLRETVSESDESNNIQKTKHACMHRGRSRIQEKALGTTLPKDQEDHIAGKG